MQKLINKIVVGCDIDGVVYNKIAYDLFLKRLEAAFFDPESEVSQLREKSIDELVDLHPVIRAMLIESVQESFQFIQDGETYHILDPIISIIDERLSEEEIKACKEVVLTSASARQSVAIDTENAMKRLRGSGILGRIFSAQEMFRSKFLLGLFGTPLAMAVVQESLEAHLSQYGDMANIQVVLNPILLPDLAMVVRDGASEDSANKDYTKEVLLSKMRGSKKPIFAGLFAQCAKLTIFIDDRKDLFEDFHLQEVVDELPGVVGMHLAGVHVVEATLPVDGVEGRHDVLHGYDYTDQLGLGEFQKRQLGGSYISWLTSHLKGASNTRAYSAKEEEGRRSEFETMVEVYTPTPSKPASPEGALAGEPGAVEPGNIQASSSITVML